MEKLWKTLDKIEEILKNIQGKGIVASPKTPSIPKPSLSDPIKKPNFKGPQSNKDPVKVAEQITNPDFKDRTIKEAKKIKDKVTVNRNGQWSLKKADEQSFPGKENIQSVSYGAQHIPNVENFGEGTSQFNIGMTEDKKNVVRHGLPAIRTAAESTMAKILGAQHMLPKTTHNSSIHHPGHEGKDTFKPTKHSGTSFQEFIDGKPIELADTANELGGLRNQWKKGDLHRLWALHYISNNGDMHSGNFAIDKDGVKAFDSDNAFYELPKGHVYDKNDEGPMHLPKIFDQVPSYLTPFVQHQNDDGVEPKHHKDELNIKNVKQFANSIKPELFQMFGDHAVKRAQEAKEALSQDNPTKAMHNLWTK